MGTFTASLRAIGDVQALPATVKLEEGRISIIAGETEIGTWPLADVHLEAIPTGYRMAAEGEQILIELKDIVGFSEALDRVSKRKSRIPSLRRKANSQEEKRDFSTDRPNTGAGQASRPQQRAAAPSTSRVGVNRDAASQQKTDRKVSSDAARSFGEKVLETIDSILAKAHKRFGSLAPDWVFSRGVFVILVVLALVMLALPGLASALLVVCGATIVLIGAIAYSDSVIASRILPGRTTPAHMLIAGLGVLLVGVIFGMISNWLS
jgi:hypothetical protein